MNRSFIAVAGAMVAFAGTVAGKSITVVGTGDPKVDIPAVQAAVDQGGRVVLKGHFSFDAPPTVAEKPSIVGVVGTVLVSKAVAISGARDDQGEMTSIEGGTHPFYVEAPGARVTIQRLHFIHSKSFAIRVVAATGLVIAANRFEGIASVGGGNAVAIAIHTSPGPPSASAPGQPENISGTLLIENNDIDVQGTTATNTIAIGVLVFAVGKSPDKEVDVYVSGNNIRNVTEPAINFRVVGGRGHVERNVLITGDVIGGSASPDAIRVVGSGSYVIAHNSIACGWVDGGATGINVFGQPSPFTPEASAIVVDNDVTMSAPEGTVFGANSAGIEIGGFAQGNSVLNNRVRGRARAALAVIVRNGGIPVNNTFVMNDLTGFQSSLADIFVDAGASNTVVIGRQATVEDHGSGTVVVPIP